MEAKDFHSCTDPPPTPQVILRLTRDEGEEKWEPVSSLTKPSARFLIPSSHSPSNTLATDYVDRRREHGQSRCDRITQHVIQNFLNTNDTLAS